MPDEQDLNEARADELALRLVALLEDAARRGLSGELVYTAAAAAALAFGARRTTPAAQAADLEAIAERLRAADAAASGPRH